MGFEIANTAWNLNKERMKRKDMISAALAMYIEVAGPDSFKHIPLEWKNMSASGYRKNRMIPKSSNLLCSSPMA